MLVIKGNYEQGANQLKDVLSKVKASEAEKRAKMKKESFK